MKVAISFFGVCATRSAELGRWQGLLNSIHSEGSQLVSVNSSELDLFIAVDHSETHLRSVSTRIPKNCRFLVLREGPSIRPDQFRRRVLIRYGRVFLATSQPKLLTAQPFGDPVLSIPYQDGFIKSEIPRKKGSTRKNHSVCMVNQNKFSLHSASNYHLRQSVLKEISRCELDITVAGRDWDIGTGDYFFNQFKSAIFLTSKLTGFRLRSLRIPLSRATKERISFEGYITDLESFLERFEFNLIIENDNMRVTEKLFSALACGCIPIYFGPNLDDFGIPRQIYVRLDHPRDILSTIERIKNMSNLEISDMRHSGERWFHSFQTQERWSEELSMRRLWSVIKDEYCRIERQ